MMNWTVVAIPDVEGHTGSARTYVRHGIDATNAWGAIGKAAEPSAAQIRKLMDLMWGAAHDQGADYDKARAILLNVLHYEEDSP